MILGLAFWITLKNQTANHGQRPSSPTQKHEPDLQAQIANKPIDQKFHTGQSRPPFQRKIPKRYISQKDLLELLSFYSDEDLHEFARKVQLRPETETHKFGYGPNALWDFSRPPTNAKEFDLAAQEEEILTIANLVEAAMNDDIKEMHTSIGKYGALQVLKAFEYLNHNESGDVNFKPRGWDQFATQMHRKMKRNPSSEHHKSLYDLESLFQDLEPALQTALKNTWDKQTLYYQDFAGRNTDKVYTRALETSSIVFSFLEYLIELSGNIPMVKSKPKEFSDHHRYKLLPMILNQIKSHPEDYGFDQKNVEKINDITDIPFELITKEIIHQRARDTALWGAGVSIVLDHIFGRSALSTGINQWRAFAVALTASLGVEVIFMSVATYQGIRQIYILHRQYSYALGEKKLHEIKYRHGTFDIDRVLDQFNSQDITFGPRFHRLAMRTWVHGTLLGKLIRSFASSTGYGFKASYAFAQRIGKYFVENSSQFISPRVANFFTAITRGPKAFLDAPHHSANTILKALTGNRSLQIPRFLHPMSLIIGGIDFSVTSTVLYASTYGVLHNSSLALFQTYMSPGTSIQLALTNSADRSSVDFATATREIMYPLCSHLAHKSRSSQTGANDQMRLKLQSSCLKLISLLEGFSTEKELRNQFPELHLRLLSKEPLPLKRSEYQDLIERGFQFPNEFRVVWLAALRSIYPLNYVAPFYWETKSNLTLGPNTSHTKNLLKEVTFIPPDKVAMMMNIDRLLYTIELVAADIYWNKHPDVIKGRKDPQLSALMDNVVEGFSAYFQFHRRLAVQNEAKLALLLENVQADEEDIGYQSLQTSFKAAFEAIWNELKSFLSFRLKKPYDWRYESQVDEELLEISRPEQ